MIGFALLFLEVFMSDSILRDKSKVFAKEIVFLCRQLKENRRRFDQAILQLFCNKIRIKETIDRKSMPKSPQYLDFWVGFAYTIIVVVINTRKNVLIFL